MYDISLKELQLKLQTDFQKGLSSKNHLQRLKKDGENLLEKNQGISGISIFVSQFKDPMVLILLAATLISLVLGEYYDAITILVIIFINAILGFVQEYKAEKSLQALAKLTSPKAKVLRDGRIIHVDTKDLVVGDIVFLTSGDKVPADLRLIETYSLEVDEAALTGESVPVQKDSSLLVEGKNIAEAVNACFMGTSVTKGRGTGVVIATGMNTAMGKIARMIQKAENEPTPLQKRLAQLGKVLVSICLVVSVMVVLLGIWRGEEIYKMFLAGVSLAVAAIPEGLPAIVTVCLAIGVQRMLKRRAIVRKLPAVETLGCATVICSDKTGTLTQNKMTVEKIFLDNKYIDITGNGYNPQGQLLEKNKVVTKDNKMVQKLMEIAVLCNTTRLFKKNIEIKGLFRRDKEQWSIDGDPTEGALLVMAAKVDYWREKVLEEYKIIKEYPFDSSRKMMSVVVQNSKGFYSYTKGAPDIILDRCNRILENGLEKTLSWEYKEKIKKVISQFASEGYRTLALSYNLYSSDNNVEKDMVFVGICAISDPPREEVYSAVEKCKHAGIKTVMITGDHKETAVAIAKQLNILPSYGRVVTGEEMNSMSDDELLEIIDDVYVFARVLPEHKLKIVKALKKKGHVVAMTGDGINDGPAIKEADIGIAMGITGTEVTKEAASLILTDDNFATIVEAVEEGRGIYDNIRKFIRFLLSCNIGEIMTMFLAMLMGLPLPLRPIQILWVNLVTDGLPALALGLEKGEKDIMLRKPRSKDESVFSNGLDFKILTKGISIGFITLTLFILGYRKSYGNLDFARTMAFSTLIVVQLFHVFECKSERKSIFEVNIFNNLYLIFAVFSSFILLMIVIYFPTLQKVFGTKPLNIEDWLLIIGIVMVPYILQMIKLLFKAIFKPVHSNR
ncbi:calcium-transporting P-type ATPase, PMR1-type [Anaerobranca gottschalkii]|uniref:P-type Ca(2+) transporter n=1 Tax=Anaerobranca gottschalkii DSM 13577 TaxID=1120990 RepID=A0A1H9YY96_9FIRM|nr:calcium-transporting P-type ATPase, PMR1-type [Anaerobranca gottschalkii]SES73677.1 Ca2+-transporting ATPase [Anaerobranca gottschalkii DSM 13577]